MLQRRWFVRLGPRRSCRPAGNGAVGCPDPAAALGLSELDVGPRRTEINSYMCHRVIFWTRTVFRGPYWAQLAI